MSDAPLIEESSLEERRAFIKDPEQAYVDYIVGNRSFMEVSSDYKH